MTKNKNKLSNAFTIILISVTFCLMISLADLFSSLITVGGFSFVSDDITFSKYQTYAVCTSSYQTKIQAQENSNNIQMQGGAGYIWENENEYVLIASVYENEPDAKKVLENILDNKPQAKIETITTPHISISSNLTTQEKETFIKTIEVFKTVYKKLYDISVSLDTSVIKEINARLQINELASDVNTIISNFDTVFPNQSSGNFLATKNAIDTLNVNMQNLIEDNYNPYTAKIKYTYTATIFLYKQLGESLK